MAGFTCVHIDDLVLTTLTKSRKECMNSISVSSIYNDMITLIPPALIWNDIIRLSLLRSHKQRQEISQFGFVIVYLANYVS